MAATRLVTLSTDSALLASVWSFAASQRWEEQSAASLWEVMALLKCRIAVHALLLDLRDLSGDGLQLLPFLRSIRPALPVLVIDDIQSPTRRRQALRLGALEYLVAPYSEAELARLILLAASIPCDHAPGNRMLDTWEPSVHPTSFICASAPMRRLCAKLAALANSDLPLIIAGEPGSGKEAIARWIHLHSARSRYPFLPIDCRALPEEKLEREFLGRGPGNGSESAPLAGSFHALLGNGTIFLKNYQDMPVRLQSTLQKILCNSCVPGRGVAEAAMAKTRVIVSYSVDRIDSGSHVSCGSEPLFPRGAVQIWLPPLRERKKDLALLVRQFVTELSAQYGLPITKPDSATRRAWLADDWPGNVSALRNAVKCYLMGHDCTGESAAASGRNAESYSAVQPTLPPASALAGGTSLRGQLQRVRRETERTAIAQALEKTGWNRMAAARLLQISYRGILYKIDQYQITPARRPLTAEFMASNSAQLCHSAGRHPPNRRLC